jgi:acyl dehydratase
MDDAVVASGAPESQWTQRSFVAANFAHESENRIHADDVAQAYGFRGGLVPGVTSMAYVAEAIAASLGHRLDDWLAGGTFTLRLLSPVYDGERIVAAAHADGSVSLRNSDGVECVQGGFTVSAGGSAGADAIARALAAGAAAIPSQRPPADESTLAPGTTLGTLQHRITDHRQRAYLASVNLDAERWDARALIHPGVLLLDANEALVANVVLGPWIHVGSTVRFHRIAALGAHIESRSVVRDRYERKGHAFVELDLAIRADGDVVATIEHTAIYRPRPVTETHA